MPVPVDEAEPVAKGKTSAGTSPGRPEATTAAEPRTSGLHAYLDGVRDALPMLIAVGPFGAVAGLAGVAAGLAAWESIAFSTIVNAGTAQLAALQLRGEGAPLLILLVSTLFINLRFLMYGLAIAPYLSGIPLGVRLPMAHVLVDQTFALGLKRFSPRPTPPKRVHYWFGVATPIYSTWIGGSVVGAFFGAAVPEGWSLEFAIPLIFIALLMPGVKDRPAWAATLVGGATAFVAAPLPHGLGLIAAAFTGIAAGLWAERHQQA